MKLKERGRSSNQSKKLQLAQSLTKVRRKGRKMLRERITVIKGAGLAQASLHSFMCYKVCDGPLNGFNSPPCLQARKFVQGVHGISIGILEPKVEIEVLKDLSRSLMIPLLFIISRCTRQRLRCSSNVNREARVRCARYILYWTHIAAVRTVQNILGSIVPQPCVLEADDSGAPEPRASVVYRFVLYGVAAGSAAAD